MNRFLRVLNVEDSEQDAALIRRHLTRAGYELISERVDTPETMRHALTDKQWDLILCDYSMPHFSALAALALLKEIQVDLPFVIISGTIGEEVAVEAMRAGAHDYLMKDNLARLAPTIERELHEAENRRARQRAEKALKDSEQELRALFAAITDVILVLDVEGRYLKIAPTKSASIYESAEERIGKKLHEIFAQKTADLLLKYVRRALAEGRTQRLEYSIPIGGQETWFEGSVSPMTEDSVIWIARNISERKQAEDEQVRLTAEIEGQEQRLNNIVANVPGVVWEAWGRPDSTSQRVNFVSDYVETMLGYSVEEWLSKPQFWLSIVHSEDRERTVRIAAEHYARGGQATFQFRWVGKDGRVVWVESNSVVITDDQGRSIGIRGVNTDISARKHAEEAVKQAEEKYRSIFENAVEGIFQSTPEGSFISVNPAMARILGYESPEDLTAHRNDIAIEHYVDANARAELERLVAELGVVVGYEVEVYRKDRSQIWTVENIRAIRNEDGRVLYYEGSIEDITERKTLAEQLRQSQKLEAIGMLAGGIAHDFNNLLTVIGGYSDLALLRLREEDPLHRNINEVRKAAQRAAGLTRQLLAFSRKQVMQPRILNLNIVVSELEKMLRRLIGEDVGFWTVLAADLGMVKADPGQIEQIVMNLAVNARDAMPQGGKLTIETANVDLDWDYARSHIAVIPGRYVMLAVSDTGTGMDQQTQTRIFEPFFTTKESGKGTGLGLSTVYGIVKQSGGNIWVYSEVGHGTTFKVYLPRVDEGVQDEKPSVNTEGAIRGSETVLLAEDEEMVRKLACQVLELYGYHVLEAANGGAALLICERYKEPIHLLITDVVMPEMSGRELADRLTQFRPQMKVLYMSGYTDKAIVHQGVLNEGANFIQKPFATEAFARKVREVLKTS